MTTEDLSADERRELQLWQKRMIALFVCSMAVLLGTMGADLYFGLSRTAASAMFVVLLVLAVLGGVVQFSQKCPRCGYRLGRQSRLVVPDNCKKCGVQLR